MTVTTEALDVEELDLSVTRQSLGPQTGTRVPVGPLDHPLQWDDPGMCLVSRTEICSGGGNTDLADGCGFTSIDVCHWPG
jgi:hypothetical protein